MEIKIVKEIILKLYYLIMCPFNTMCSIKKPNNQGFLIITDQEALISQ